METRILIQPRILIQTKVLVQTRILAEARILAQIPARAPASQGLRPGPVRSRARPNLRPAGAEAWWAALSPGAAGISVSKLPVTVTVSVQLPPLLTFRASTRRRASALRRRQCPR